MNNKIILDLCGGTGAWSLPYLEAGYNVINITLPAYDIMSYSPPQKNVYGILASPPCTEFSLAKSTKPRNFKIGMALVKRCLEIIWEVRINQKLKFWALENPRCFTRQFLGKPVFVFEQWEFGDKGIKPTDIWGYFNIPQKTVKQKPNQISRTYPCGSRNAVGWSKSAEKRAITPAGFASAFFEANK